MRAAAVLSQGSAKGRRRHGHVEEAGCSQAEGRRGCLDKAPGRAASLDPQRAGLTVNCRQALLMRWPLSLFSSEAKAKLTRKMKKFCFLF